MKIFSYLYRKALSWSQNRHAPYYLVGLSFIESSVFPIPPDVMLIPMSLARRNRAIYYALLTTLSSVLGGLFGYWIGAIAFDLIHPYLITFGYWQIYLQVEHWFHLWGFWIILIAGFSPIPYKLFTIAAGSLHIALFPFILASFLGRGGRFFGLALLIRWGGPQLDRWLHQYIDRITWLCLFLGMVGCFVKWQGLHH